MNKTALKKKLLTFTKGMTPLHFACAYENSISFKEVLEKGRSVNALEEMLTQKYDVSLASESSGLHKKYRPGFSAIDYMLEMTGEINCGHFELLQRVNVEAARRVLTNYRTQGNGTLLHTALVLHYTEYFHEWINAIFSANFKLIALVRDNQGQNFLMSNFNSLLDRGFDFAKYLCSIEPSISAHLLTKADNNGDSLAVFIFASCPISQIKQILENDSLAEKFKQVLFEKNINGQSGVHFFANKITASNVGEVNGRHAILEGACPFKYRSQLTDKDNNGAYPIIEIYRSQMRNQVDTFTRGTDLENYLRRCGSEFPEALQKMLTVEGDGGITVLHCLDAHNPKFLLFCLDKLPIEKLEDVLFLENLPGKSMLFKLISHHGVTDKQAIEELLKKVDCDKAAQCFATLEVKLKLPIFRIFPVLYRPLFLNLSDSNDQEQFLLKQPVQVKKVLTIALTSNSSEHLAQILANVSSNDLTDALVQYLASVDLSKGVNFKSERFSKLVDSLSVGDLKRIIAGLDQSLHNLLYLVAFYAPKKFSRVFELLDKQHQQKVISFYSEKLLDIALVNTDYDLIKYLVEKGFKPSVMNCSQAIRSENWPACHLFVPLMSPFKILYGIHPDVNVSVRELLEGFPIDRLTRVFYSCLAIFVQSPYVTNFQGSNNLQKLFIHASRYYDVYKKDTNLGKVINEKTIQVFIKHFPGDGFIWDVDTDARLALFNKLHETAFGEENHIPVKNFTDDVDMFLMNFLCRVVTSKLPGFRSGLGAPIYDVPAVKQHALRMPLLLSRSGLREGRSLAIRMTDSEERALDVAAQNIVSDASPRQMKL